MEDWLKCQISSLVKYCQKLTPDWRINYELLSIEIAPTKRISGSKLKKVCMCDTPLLLSFNIIFGHFYLGIFFLHFWTWIFIRWIFIFLLYFYSGFSFFAFLTWTNHLSYYLRFWSATFLTSSFVFLPWTFHLWHFLPRTFVGCIFTLKLSFLFVPCQAWNVHCVDFTLKFIHCIFTLIYFQIFFLYIFTLTSTIFYIYYFLFHHISNFPF